MIGAESNTPISRLQSPAAQGALPDSTRDIADRSPQTRSGRDDGLGQPLQAHQMPRGERYTTARLRDFGELHGSMCRLTLEFWWTGETVKHRIGVTLRNCLARAHRSQCHSRHASSSSLQDFRRPASLGESVHHLSSTPRDSHE